GVGMTYRVGQTIGTVIEALCNGAFFVHRFNQATGGIVEVPDAGIVAAGGGAEAGQTDVGRLAIGVDQGGQVRCADRRGVGHRVDDLVVGVVDIFGEAAVGFDGGDLAADGIVQAVGLDAGGVLTHAQAARRIVKILGLAQRGAVALQDADQLAVGVIGTGGDEAVGLGD